MKGMYGTQLGIYWPDSNCAYYNNELTSHSSIEHLGYHSRKKAKYLSLM